MTQNQYSAGKILWNEIDMIRYHIETSLPLDWNSACRGEGASHQEVSTQVRQREELNWASQLKSLDQQIFSRMSGTDSLFD